ncbi:MAG: Smr/MutS family protein [Gemmatimonadales bacterium]
MAAHGRKKLGTGSTQALREIDLHQHTSATARTRLIGAIEALHVSAPGCTVRIITGRGVRSREVAVLSPMVEALLRNGKLPHVMRWEMAPDGGSFVVEISGRASSTRPAKPKPPEAEARALLNRLNLERAKRKAEREAAASADETEECLRLESLRKELRVRNLPAWLCAPPQALVLRRAARAREEAEEAVHP